MEENNKGGSFETAMIKLLKRYKELSIDVIGNISWDVRGVGEEKDGKSIAYMDVSEGRIYINEELLRKNIGTKDEDYICLMLHEILHLKLMHHTRREGRHFEVWNISCDAEIHSIFNKYFEKEIYDVALRAGVTVEQLRKKGYKVDEDMTAEEIYDEVMRELKRRGRVIQISVSGGGEKGKNGEGMDGRDGEGSEGGDGKNGKGKSGGKGKGKGKRKGNNEGEEKDEVVDISEPLTELCDKNGNTSGELSEEKGGSGGKGKRSSGKGRNKGGDGDDIEDISNENKIKDKVIRTSGNGSGGRAPRAYDLNQVAEAIQKMTGRGEGGGLLGKIRKKEMRESPDLARLLIKRIREMEGITSRSYGRMNTVGVNNISLIPGYYRKRKAVKVLVGIDTSGSISSEELGLVYAFLEKLLKEVSNIEVVTCDTKIHNDVVIKSRNDLENMFNKGDIKGGGGTDMNPIVRYGKEKRAETVIIITDGYLSERLEPQEKGERYVVLYKDNCNKDIVKNERVLYIR